MIHNVKKIDDVRKLSTLSKETIINSLTIIGSNYKIVYDTLENRYRNTKILVNTYIENLLSVKPIATESSYALRKLCDTFIKNISCLRNEKQPVKHWNSFLVYLLSSKFDSITRREWELNSHESEISSFEDIITFLVKMKRSTKRIGRRKTSTLSLQSQCLQECVV